MSDEQINPDLNFEEAEPEIEVLRTSYEPIPDDPDAKLPENYRGKTKEDLVAELQRTQQEIELARRNGDTAAALRKGIENLGQTLNRPSQPASQTQDQSNQLKQLQERRAALSKKLKEEFLDDPEGALTEYTNLTIQPIVGQLLMNQIPITRKIAVLDPEVGHIMKKYGPEVDAYVDSLPPEQKINNPDLYIKAAKMVQMNHFEELLEEKVNAKLNEKLAAAGTAPAGAPRQPLHAEGTGNPRPPASKAVPKLNQEEKNFCFVRGIDEEDYLRSKYGLYNK